MRNAVASVFALLSLVTFANAQEIICVNGSATPPPICRDITLPNGQVVTCAEAVPDSISGNACWDNAYIDLQDALDEAAALADQGSPDDIGVEIWVAAGTYHPDRGTGDREMSFSLHKNVELYGGFAGWETFRDQRDFVNNETILSGDLNDDDDPDGDFLGGSSSCCTEHDAPGCDDTECELNVCTDRFGSQSLRCCTDKWDKFCTFRAARLCCNACSTRGDCDNSVHVIVAFDTDTSTIIDGLTITSGRTKILSNNSGAGILIEDGGAILRNCVFRNNVGIRSSAVQANNSDVIVKKCLFTDNNSFPYTHPATIFSLSDFSASGSITVEDSAFIRNDGAGVHIRSKQGTVLRTTFLENKGAGINVGSRVTIDDCRFIRNTSPQPVVSAGIDNSGGSHSKVRNCQFIGNETGGAGAAFDNNGFAELYNCLFIGNKSGGRAFVNGFGGFALLEHCTFVDNNRGGVLVAQGVVELNHCILWNNRPPGPIADESSLADQIFTFSNGIARASYTALQGYDGPDGKFPGAGNTGADPMFVDEDGPDDIPGNEDDNLRLRPDSPLIDAGDPDATLFVDRDLDGHTRILCGRIDFGPYELGIGDFDCNGQVDLSDLANLPACMTNPGDTTTTAPCSAFDFNADKAVDLSDYAVLQTIIINP